MLKTEVIVVKKIIVIFPLFFLSVLISCSLSDNSSSVSVMAPEEDGILLRGERFTLVAEIEAYYGIQEINIELWLPDGITENSYDSILWSSNISDVGLSFTGKIKIEKKLTIPPDVPIDDSYYLQINACEGGGGIGYTMSVPVSVLESKY
jgi:hypothetical protein